METLTHRPSSQRLNNEDYLGSRPSTGRASAVMVRNTLSDVNTGALVIQSDEYASVSGSNGQAPRPPSGERKSSGVRNRTISSFTKNSFEQ